MGAASGFNRRKSLSTEEEIQFALEHPGSDWESAKRIRAQIFEANRYLHDLKEFSAFITRLIAANENRKLIAKMLAESKGFHRGWFSMNPGQLKALKRLLASFEQKLHLLFALIDQEIKKYTAEIKRIDSQIDARVGLLFDRIVAGLGNRYELVFMPKDGSGPEKQEFQITQGTNGSVEYRVLKQGQVIDGIIERSELQAKFGDRYAAFSKAMAANDASQLRYFQNGIFEIAVARGDIPNNTIKAEEREAIGAEKANVIAGVRAGLIAFDDIYQHVADMAKVKLVERRGIRADDHAQIKRIDALVQDGMARDVRDTVNRGLVGGLHDLQAKRNLHMQVLGEYINLQSDVIAQQQIVQDVVQGKASSSSLSKADHQVDELMEKLKADIKKNDEAVAKAQSTEAKLEVPLNADRITSEVFDSTSKLSF